jgi:hypothetical protein
MQRVDLRLSAYGALLLVAIASLFFSKLSPFLLVVCLVAYLGLPAGASTLLRGLCLASAGLVLLAFVRFLVVEAVPGIVEGGIRAVRSDAVSQLRQIVFTQDALRRRADVDPDGDRIGSAALLDELTGRVGLRGGARLSPPLLERYPAPLDTPSGPAFELAGYLFIVCLPRKDGGFTARPGEPIDEEAAERRFVAYAWPANQAQGLTDAFFIDEHERILIARQRNFSAGQAPLGPERPPACDAALLPGARKVWRTFRGKRPRQTLPGDRAP